MNDDNIDTIIQVRDFLSGTRKISFILALLHGSVTSHLAAAASTLRDAMAIRHPKLRHSVQNRARKRNLRLLRWHRPTPHRAADNRFVSRHRRRDQTASCIARFMLTSSAATGINDSRYKF